MKKQIVLAALAALLLPVVARAAADWQTFRSEAGGFEVQLPGIPTEATEAAEGVEIHKFMLESEENRAFGVIYAQPEGELSGVDAAELFASMREGFLEGA